MDEFKKDVPENSFFKENELEKENQVFKENVPAKENTEAKEYSDSNLSYEEQVKKSKIDQNKKKKALGILTGSLTAIIAGTVFGMTNYLNVKMTANISNFVYEDSKVSCLINVQDMTDKETLNMYVYEDNNLVDGGKNIYKVDDFVENKLPFVYLIDPDHIKELLKTAPNKQVIYRFDLKGVVGLNVEREYDSYILKIDEVKQSEEIKVTGECTCSIDHCYNFTLDFVDSYNLYYDFEAYIEDSFGNTSYCSWENDVHETQKINVLDLVGSKATLHISYSCKGQEERIKIDQEINL